MAHQISLLFHLRNSRLLNSGQFPIYLRITINGKRFEISTGKSIDKVKWSSKLGRCRGKSLEACSVNGHLDALKAKVFLTEGILLKTNSEISITSFKEQFLGKSEIKRMLIPIFLEHNRRMEMLIPHEFSINTLKKFKTTLAHIRQFLEVKRKMTDIDITKIDLTLIHDFDFFLRTIKECNHNSTVKYISLFGKIIRECHNKEWITRDPFANYDFSLHKVEIEFLSQVELNVMQQKVLKIERLDLVRDIYVFACFTGLSYIDIEQLTSDNLTIGIDGTKWIYKDRQKTKGQSHIPLLPLAEQILVKYANHPRCLNKNKLLPILSNQKMNAYLKEIADICGINKELTFHTSRHTFATTVTLENGVPIETVSKMLGHNSIRSTQHYAKVMDSKISKDMAELKEKIQIDIKIAKTVGK